MSKEQEKWIVWVDENGSYRAKKGEEVFSGVEFSVTFWNKQITGAVVDVLNQRDELRIQLETAREANREMEARLDETKAERYKARCERDQLRQETKGLRERLEEVHKERVQFLTQATIERLDKEAAQKRLAEIEACFKVEKPPLVVSGGEVVFKDGLARIGEYSHHPKFLRAARAFYREFGNNFKFNDTSISDRGVFDEKCRLIATWDELDAIIKAAEEKRS